MSFNPFAPRSQEAPPVSIRPASNVDRKQLSTLIHFGAFVHRHLDWRHPLAWLGSPPFYVAEKNNHLVAAIACPPDPENIAWIRLFAATSEVQLSQSWESLWRIVKDTATDVCVAAIPVYGWFQDCLAGSGFLKSNQVVILEWGGRYESAPPKADCTIRPMTAEDIPKVQFVDASAFSPIWRISDGLLSEAFSQAALATVAEEEGVIIGYQISTASSNSGHLARLAVHPHKQGHGVGFALVTDMLDRFQSWGTLKVTVNTQVDNSASLRLYKKAGFSQTDEVFPVYQYDL